MGRKKKKASKQKSWCWYCNREFDDDKILVQHQKAKHFKCHICHKKLYTGPGLSIHCMQVHKESIDKVPNSLPNRSNIDIEIYGMEGIPPEDIREHERQKNGAKSESEDEEPVHKKQKTVDPGVAAAGMVMPNLMMTQFGAMPQMMMAGMPQYGMPGMPPMMPQHMMGGPPPRPLFPAAAATSLANASMLQQQAKPTFPAYSNATISAPPTTNSASSTNAASKIMHPADDLSLEELRARKPKYRKGGGSSGGYSTGTPGQTEHQQPTAASSAISMAATSMANYTSNSHRMPPTSMATSNGMAAAQAAAMAAMAAQQIPTSMADQQSAALLAAQAQAMAQVSQQNQKQFEDMNRVVMMQRFQQAAAAGQRGPPTIGMMQMASPFAPQMMRPMAFSPQAAAMLGQNMMRPPGMGMPPGLLAQFPGMPPSLAAGMMLQGHPGIMGMMPPRFR